MSSTCIYFASNRQHAIPLFALANIFPVHKLYYKSVSILMHDINNNIAPPNLLNLFTRLASVHSYET